MNIKHIQHIISRHIKPKNVISTGFIVLAVTFFMSCDKMDENGALDGNWQLTEWRDAATDTIIATRYTHRIYYTVKLNLLKFQNMDDSDSFFCLAYFRHSADSLLIDKAFKRPYDEEIPLDSLCRYGCPADGKYIIRQLTNDHMTLQSDIGTLQFRKY